MTTEKRYQLMLNVQQRFHEYRKKYPNQKNTAIVVWVADEFNISEATLYRYLKRKLQG